MNIAHRIQEVAQRIPDKKSVVLAKDSSFYTFQDFEEKSNQFANKFVALGITPGMRTLLFVKPCLDFSVITFALFKVGAVPVLIDPGMGISNLLNSVKQVRPEAIVSIGMVHWVRRFTPSYFQNLKVKISLSPVGGSVDYLYEDLEKYSKVFTPYAVSPTDPSAILFTSGGTGIPKGVMYTHGILNAQTDALQSMFSLNENKIDLPGFPLFALFTLAMGMSSVIPEMDPTKPAKCDPKKIVKNILDHKITFVAGSPAIWERVGKYCIEKNIKLDSVEQVVMFGAPVRAEIHQMFKNILTKGDTFTPYGATECLPVALISGSEVLKHHLSNMLKGFGTCLGKAVPGVTIKIIKTTDIPEVDLNEISAGQVGEIAFRLLRGILKCPLRPPRRKSLRTEYSGTAWETSGGWMMMEIFGF
jgi:acyl-CoA synthetase (AMP-forming)/AMP-acid ligase II